MLCSNNLFKYLLTTTFLWLFVPQLGFSQLEEDFQPIQMKGEIPNGFLKRVRGDTKVKFENSYRLDKEASEQFVIATQYALKEIFHNGNIYFNDPLTSYVRKVGDQLLKNTPWQSEIEFYISRFNSPNATAWQDGTVLVNIGLLARLENEAQLAFTMAHELAHYLEQHPYKQYARFVQSKHHHAANKPFVADVNSGLGFETQADSFAIALMRKAKYNYEEGLKVLKIVQKDEKRVPMDFATALSSDRFQITAAHICKAQQYFDLMEVDAYAATSEVIFDTRERFMYNLIVRSEFDRTLQNFVVSEPLFNKARTIAQFELVEQAYQEANYLRSIYEALILLNQYPSNRYLQIKIAENLYNINTYNQLSTLNRIFVDYKKIEEDGYANFCCFMSKISQPDLKKLVYGYVQRVYADYPSDERVVIIMAKTVEQTYAMELAKPYYEQYLKQFPEGEHVLLAKHKIQ